MRFLEAWNKVKSFCEDSDDTAISAIFSGINVAEDFWDNFLLVCNNKEGLAELLNVSPEKIASWSDRVQRYLDKSREHGNPEAKEKTQVMDTGVSI
jgi:hypothetical protein